MSNLLSFVAIILLDHLLVLDPHILYQGLLADCGDDISLKSHLELAKSISKSTIMNNICPNCQLSHHSNTTAILAFASEGKFYSMIQAMILHGNRQTRGVLKITTGRFWKLQSSSVVGCPTGTICWCVLFCSGYLLHYTLWAHWYCLQYYTLIPSKGSAVAVERIFRLAWHDFLTSGKFAVGDN